MKRYFDKLCELGRNRLTHDDVFEQRLERLAKVNKSHSVAKAKAPLVKSQRSPQAA